MNPITMTHASPELDEELQTDLVDSGDDMWRVIIHNDDVTTFEFVIRILQAIFNVNIMTAEQIAWRTHTAGFAYVATYPKAEAQKRVDRAHFAAQLEGFPLRLTIEPEEDGN